MSFYRFASLKSTESAENTSSIFPSVLESRTTHSGSETVNIEESPAREPNAEESPDSTIQVSSIFSSVMEAGATHSISETVNIEESPEMAQNVEESPDFSIQVSSIFPSVMETGATPSVSELVNIEESPEMAQNGEEGSESSYQVSSIFSSLKSPIEEEFEQFWDALDINPELVSTPSETQYMDFEEFLDAMEEEVNWEDLDIFSEDQVGGGGEHSNLEMQYITEAELDFFNKHAEIEYGGIERKNAARMALPPTRMRFTNMDKVEGNLADFHTKIFDIFLRRYIGKAGGTLENTEVWLGMNHPGFKEKQGFWTPKEKYTTTSGATVTELIAKLCQSNTRLAVDEYFTLELHIFVEEDDLVGGASDRQMFDEKLKIPAKVQGGFCLVKAVALAFIFAAKDSSPPAEKKAIDAKIKALTKPKYGEKKQMEEAVKVMEKAGIPKDQALYSRADFVKIARVYPEYRFVLWSREEFHNTYSMVEELNAGASKLVSLVYFRDHYDCAQPTAAAFEVFWCNRCFAFQSGTNHAKTCKANCRLCGHPNCDTAGPSLTECADCRVRFPNQKCFENHKKAHGRVKSSHCALFKRCPACHVSYRVSNHPKGHVCGATKFCKICRKHVSPKGTHECSHNPPTMEQSKKLKESQQEFCILVYDLECQVVDDLDPFDSTKPAPVHRPNLVVYKIFCGVCCGRAGFICPAGCSGGVISYNDTDDVIGKFGQILLTDKRLNGAFVVAHNGGRYDHNYVLAELMKNDRVTPNIIASQQSLISGDVSKVKDKAGKIIQNELHFRDSMLHLPMRLAAMPKAFGIDELKKGYYPYLFNHPDNYGKVFPKHPEERYYDVRHMSVKDREDFDAWYAENKEKEYDFDKELVEYCKSDVEILAQALVKYIEIVKEALNGWNPILSARTLAGFVMHMIKHDHARDGDIGFIPENGYPGRNNSELALKYLLWLEKKTGTPLKHQLRGGEYEVTTVNRKTFVDGYDATNNVIHEIHGCVYHGCPKCFDPNEESRVVKGVLNSELYERTIVRDQELTATGAKVVVVWEHEIRQMLKADKEMAAFFELCRHAHTLHPRESMFGGRVQPFKNIVHPKEDETVEYWDFCSLYPWVNINSEYPRGQPEVIREEFRPVHNNKLPYRGLVYCDVLPPTSLKFPVLPYRSGGKLLFPLCRTCAERRGNDACTHANVGARFLTGIWYSEELNAALERGYKLLKYHEVWNWEDKLWVKGGFFASYLKPLLKLKHQASGWPRAGMTDAEKQQYVDRIEATDGVRLDIDKIAKNPALRSLAKLFLNSAWGKFAENPQKLETKIFRTKEHIPQARFMNEAGYTPKMIKDWPHEITLITRICERSSLTTRPFANIVIGSITTAMARLRLYQAMEMVGDNLAYVDTDSLIFTQKKGEKLVESLCGSGLGALENEVGEGETISRFVAIAPKVYGYEVTRADGSKNVVIKAKGVTVDSTSSKDLTLDNLEDMVHKHIRGDAVTPLTTTRPTFKRKLFEKVSTVHHTKQLRPVTDKLRTTVHGVTMPLGFRNTATIVQDYPY